MTELVVLAASLAALIWCAARLLGRHIAREVDRSFTRRIRGLDP